MFRAERRKAIRENWKDWLVLVLLISILTAGLLAEAIVRGGILQIATAALWAFSVTVAIVIWCAGGDPHNLVWLWGWAGERQTAALLEDLDNSWICVHDIPNGKANWDHVLVGPPGLFLLDTKRLKRTSKEEDDALRSGRTVYPGKRFSAAAAGLRYALEARAGKLWVNAVVVIWGDFPQKRHKENEVEYLQSDQLLSWLSEQSGGLSERGRKAIAHAVRELKEASNQPTLARTPGYRT